MSPSDPGEGEREDERVKLPFDPEEALRALLEVGPESEPAGSEAENPGDNETRRLPCE